MSEEEGKKLKIENLIFKLNTLADQRMQLHDQIWTLEEQGEKLRLELMALLTKTCEEKGDK